MRAGACKVKGLNGEGKVTPPEKNSYLLWVLIVTLEAGIQMEKEVIAVPYLIKHL